MKPSMPHSRDLHKTVFIYSTFFVVVLLALISIFTIGPMYGRLMKVEEKGLVHLAESQAVAVGGWVLRARELALQIAGRTTMRDKLEAYTRGKISLSDLVGHSKPRLMTALLLTDELVGISRFDRNRKPVVQSGVPLLEDVLPQFPEEGQAFNLGPPQYIAGNPYGVVGVEIKDSRDELLGTDILLIDADRLEKIVAGAPEKKQNLETIIGFRYLDQTHSFFPLNKVNGAAAPETLVPKDLAPYLEKAIKGASGLAEVGEQIVAFAPVEGSSWGCLVRTDKTGFRTPVIGSLVRAFSGILIFLVLGLLTLWFFLKPVVNKVFKEVRNLEEDAAAKTKTAASETREREKAEKVLSASQELSTAVFDQVRDPLIFYNLEGRVNHLNPAFQKAFGWSLEECLGKKLDYVPSGENPEPEQLAELLEKGRDKEALATRRYDKKGRLIDVSLLPVYCRDEQTGLGGSAAVLRLDQPN